MLERTVITKENIEYAIKIHRAIFPEFDARANYEQSLAEGSAFRYYLLYFNGECAGITGYYTDPADADSAWMGWFGILPQFRRKGLGTEALRMFFEDCANDGRTHARLYTDLYNNYDTILFYLKNGMIGELYCNRADSASDLGILIFSKTVKKGAPFKPWNNRMLNLQAQIEKQSRKN